MEELLPLEVYHARSEQAVRRMAAAGGVAFGAVMGSATGIGLAWSVGAWTVVLAGLVTAGLTGSVFAGFWGSTMLRMRRADDERAYDNEAELMGESLEDSFRYRMPCSLVEGKKLVPGTLYLDRDRAAFVPVRKLAAKVETIHVALGSAAFRIASWGEAPWRARWAHGGTPMLLEVSAIDRALRFLTPDAVQAMARLSAALPGAATPPPGAR